MKQYISKYRLSIRLISLIFAIGLVFIGSSAYCQEDDPCVEKEKWKFVLTPYVNTNSLDVDMTVSGLTADVDVDFSDLMDEFDVWGAAVVFGGRKGNWGFLLNGSYIDVSGDYKLNGLIIDRVDVEIEQAIIDAALTYRLFEGPLRKKCYLHTAIDVWGGARYNYLKQEITPRHSSGLRTTLGKSKDWVEPLVGAKISVRLTKRISFVTMGNVSGFGVGSASDKTWDVTTGFSYQLFENASLHLAYRVYDIDYSNGSGTEEFGMDGKVEGPWLGMSFYF
jgi:opacity protein-like surface antigen